MTKASLTPLSDWSNQAAEYNVAVRAGELQSKQQFLDQVQLWKDALSHYKDTRCAVYCEDAYEFAAIIFALWQLGCTACIPADNRPATLRRMAKLVDGFVGQLPNEISTQFSYHIILNKKNASSRSAEAWHTLKHDFHALEIYTSGSTGEPKSIIKTLSQIEAEIEALETLWPTQEEQVVLSTVSHQHYYGMTFRLFWPLSCGHTFASTICEYPEDIVSQARQYPRFCLISSPSHLSRINQALPWVDIAEGCQYVISSAAPLSLEDSRNVQQLLSAPIREIYGSSETGAIAWRIQTKDKAAWQALPKVKLSINQQAILMVESAYQATKAATLVGDKVEFDEQGGFTLLGRMDRIVKVEGKRVSLDLLEQLLLKNSQYIKQVKALILNTHKVEVAIVAELNEQGVEQLVQQGRKLLIKQFKAHLSEQVERVVLPRRWRFVDHLPYNQQGKLPLSSLQELFDNKKVDSPQIISQNLQEGVLSIKCYIPPKLIYFQGHFDQQAILPGVVQVHWAIQYGRQFLSVPGHFLRLEVIKFMQVITPDSFLTLTLDYKSQSQRLSFKFESAKAIHSSGRICFSEENGF